MVALRKDQRPVNCSNASGYRAPSIIKQINRLHLEPLQ